MRRRTLTSAILVPTIVGLIGLMRLMSDPRFENYRTVDVLQLIGSGLCFGLAFAALIALVRSRRSA